MANVNNERGAHRGGRSRGHHRGNHGPRQPRQPYPHYSQEPPMFYPPPAFMPPFIPHQAPPPGVEVGTRVVAPYFDGNYYPGNVLEMSKYEGVALIQFNHIAAPAPVAFAFIQKVE